MQNWHVSSGIVSIPQINARRLSHHRRTLMDSTVCCVRPRWDSTHECVHAIKQRMCVSRVTDPLDRRVSDLSQNDLSQNRNGYWCYTKRLYVSWYQITFNNVARQLLILKTVCATAAATAFVTRIANMRWAKSEMTLASHTDSIKSGTSCSNV